MFIRESIVFISNTCKKFVLLHAYLKTMNQCIVQPVCRLSWAKCFVTSGVESTQILELAMKKSISIVSPPTLGDQTYPSLHQNC